VYLSYGDPSHEPPAGTVAAAAAVAMKRLAPVLAAQQVRVDIAVQPRLAVRMSDGALADLLEELLAAAAHSAPASRMLLAAGAQGDRVSISVSDDSPLADPMLRQSLVRGVMERVALRGGALDVDVRPAEGTTMTLRLAGSQNRAEVPSTPVARPVAAAVTAQLR
jgi:signal transduction histidine kinase